MSTAFGWVPVDSAIDTVVSLASASWQSNWGNGTYVKEHTKPCLYGICHQLQVTGYTRWRLFSVHTQLCSQDEQILGEAYSVAQALLLLPSPEKTRKIPHTPEWPQRSLLGWHSWIGFFLCASKLWLWFLLRGAGWAQPRAKKNEFGRNYCCSALGYPSFLWEIKM